MKLSDFDYHLPKNSIAQYPAPKRDHSRLLVLNKNSGTLEHAFFYQLPQFLLPGDTLVMNDTKVIPARLVGKRLTGGKVEALLIKRGNSNQWEVLLNTARHLKESEILTFDHHVECRVLQRIQNGKWVVQFNTDIEPFLDKIGQPPLPPYIKRKEGTTPEDTHRYQTIYALHEGAVAAPTAGLHFTEQLIEELRHKGIEIAYVTLHVGIGTFKPITVEEIEHHQMEAEYYKISPESAERIRRAKQENRRIIAVGTTSCRTLESSENLTKLSGWTSLFIYPSFNFKIVNALITNFHLPQSTLLLLVSAFAGRDKILKAYEEAKTGGYRFYSYGDAMLIVE